MISFKDFALAAIVALIAMPALSDEKANVTPGIRKAVSVEGAWDTNPFQPPEYDIWIGPPLPSLYGQGITFQVVKLEHTRGGTLNTVLGELVRQKRPGEYLIFYKNAPQVFKPVRLTETSLTLYDCPAPLPKSGCPYQVWTRVPGVQ